MLTPQEILFIILSLLGTDNAKVDDTAKTRMVELSQAISDHQSETVSAHTLIAVSFVEDRFSYDGDQGANHKGACGPYQQIPKWAAEEVTCSDLADPEIATRVAVKSIKWFYKTFGEKLDTLCHYNGGMKCVGDAVDYAEDVKATYRKSKSLLKRYRSKTPSIKATIKKVKTRKKKRIHTPPPPTLDYVGPPPTIYGDYVGPPDSI